MDEKINLIGSLKAHREHCQHLESTLQNLEIQASNLPQVPSEMINTIQELKKDVLYTFQFPTTSTAPTDENNSEVEFHSESDLSCCDGGQDDHPGGDNVEVEEKISNISSSHSMSRYGSESPLRSLLQMVCHSSEIRGLCLMKLPTKMLQKLSYFYFGNMKNQHIVFFFFSCYF